MLERLREKKRCVHHRSLFFVQTTPNMLLYIIYFLKRARLREFSDKVIDTKAAGYRVPQYASVVGGAGAGGAGGGSNVQMEVDSNASTPA
jgi:hypothetical protein